MEQVKSNLPLGLLLSYVIKIIATTPTMQDSYIILGLILLVAAFKKLEETASVESYEAQVKALEDKHTKIQVEFREIQSALQATKLIQSVKTFPGVNSGGR